MDNGRLPENTAGRGVSSTLWPRSLDGEERLNAKKSENIATLRVDLNEECFSVFISVFPKFRYFPMGKKNMKHRNFGEKMPKKN